MELENEMARGRQRVVARWAASQGRTPIAEGNQGRRGPRKEAPGRWEVGCAGWVDTSGSLDPCPTEREGGRETHRVAMAFVAAAATYLISSPSIPRWGLETGTLCVS